MPKFFVPDLSEETVFLTGEDARHVGRALRCRVGEELTLCDGRGIDARCRILAIGSETVELRVEEKAVSLAEPPVFVTLYQSLPKGEKLDLIVQKAVELGVGAIVPVLTRYCVSRPEKKAMEKKRERLQKIALEAAKQSGRGRVPEVLPGMDFSGALASMARDPVGVFFYEKAQGPLGQVLEEKPSALSMMVGPEGGFSPEEAQAAQAAGLSLCTMGPRILRCETAPLYALSAVMYHYENLYRSEVL